ncbi:MAG TPA: helix-turn-helix transcriptional regulator [Caulobacteraceae bacterium]
MPLTPHQIRAGRALLNWSRPKLAKKTGVSLSTITRAETAPARPVTLRAIQAVLEQEGVEFIPNGAKLRPK